jgi:hypothetical protein
LKLSNPARIPGSNRLPEPNLKKIAKFETNLPTFTTFASTILLKYDPDSG